MSLFQRFKGASQAGVHAADPQRVSDAALYDGITSQFADWLKAIRVAGIWTR